MIIQLFYRICNVTNKLKLLTFLLLTICLLILSSCKLSDFIITQPKFTGDRKATYNHENITQCTPCNEGIRPITIFAHGDNQDCIKCHSANTNSSGLRSWLNFSIYSHLPFPNTCITCHENKRPLSHSSNSTTLGMNNADCLNCHRSTNNWTNIINFDHEIIKPLICLSCHNSSRPQVVIHHLSEIIPK